MLANALFFLFAVSFIAGFITLLIFGHVLLARAVWPSLFKRSATQRNAARGPARQVHPFNWYGRLADSK